jgi:malate permease and related proteins
MAPLIFSFNVIMPIFLVVLFGYVIKHFRLIDDNFINTAVKFNFKVGLAALLFKNVYTTNIRQDFDLKLTGFSILCILGTVIVLCLIVPSFIKDKKRASAMIHTIYRSNFLILGIPLAVNMFGESNIAPVALLMPIVIPIYNFLAVFILLAFDENLAGNSGKKTITVMVSVIKNPLILSSIAAMSLQLFYIKIPVFIEKAIFDIASIATPLALITLGAQFNFKSAVGNIKYSAVASVGRLIINPLIVVLIAILVGFRGYELGAIFILFSSSSAVTCYLMAKEMNSDYELTGDVVLITSLFSVITIFIGLYLLRFAELI